MVETQAIVVVVALTAAALASMIAAQEVDLLAAAFEALGLALQEAQTR